MTTLEKRIENLERQIMALAGRNVNGKLDDVKGKIAQTIFNLESLDEELAESILALTETLVDLGETEGE